MKVITGRPGRPREFDIDVATRDAMEVFWQNGFHATSLPDLIEGMRLTRGSIYKAYDDKRSIYLAALDVFIAEKLANYERYLAKKDKVAALRDALRRAAREGAGGHGQRGCFVAAATLEMVPNDAEVEARVATHYRGLERLFATAIDEGKRGGSITAATPTATLARFMVVTVEGMCVLGKLGPSERSHPPTTNRGRALLPGARAGGAAPRAPAAGKPPLRRPATRTHAASAARARPAAPGGETWRGDAPSRPSAPSFPPPRARSSCRRRGDRRCR